MEDELRRKAEHPKARAEELLVPARIGPEAPFVVAAIDFHDEAHGACIEVHDESAQGLVASTERAMRAVVMGGTACDDRRAFGARPPEPGPILDNEFRCPSRARRFGDGRATDQGVSCL